VHAPGLDGYVAVLRDRANEGSHLIGSASATARSPATLSLPLLIAADMACIRMIFGRPHEPL
jgi:hypothetical protein